jgi:hypothetical protein
LINQFLLRVIGHYNLLGIVVAGNNGRQRGTSAQFQNSIKIEPIVDNRSQRTVCRELNVCVDPNNGQKRCPHSLKL